MFRKILIANRGEIAVRVLRACQEMEIATVAVYSGADANAFHVRLTDEAACIGPPVAAESYLRGDKIIEAAIAHDCDAIHPGYGFLAESPTFARAVRDAGLVFIGPPTGAIEKLGNKTQARAIMEAAGIPVAAGFFAASATEEELLDAAGQIGYPVIVKAAGGGGGVGLRVVHTVAELRDAVVTSRRTAQKAFGDPAIFLEKYIARGRHIECQILADNLGNTVHLFERDCSIQRRHQKIIEETPAPLIPETLRRALGETAIEVARSVGYVNAGTVEFIVDEEANFFFLEMNTRLQVEHPVTEMVTGVDLVRSQIEIAAGEPLRFIQGDLRQWGHAIECRIYAEDPAHDFLPGAGRVHWLDMPSGPGIRVDTGVAAGDIVSAHYDPMIAKLIVWAQDRPTAIRRMGWALAQYTLLGLPTNLQFLREAIDHPVFVSGEATTHFIDEHMQPWQPQDDGLIDVALIAAALAEVTESAIRGQAVGGVEAGNSLVPWRRRDSFRLGA